MKIPHNTPSIHDIFVSNLANFPFSLVLRTRRKSMSRFYDFRTRLALREMGAGPRLICIVVGLSFLFSLFPLAICHSLFAMSHITYAINSCGGLAKGVCSTHSKLLPLLEGSNYVVRCVGVGGRIRVAFLPSFTLSPGGLASYDPEGTMCEPMNEGRGLGFGISEDFRPYPI